MTMQETLSSISWRDWLISAKKGSSIETSSLKTSCSRKTNVGKQPFVTSDWPQMLMKKSTFLSDVVLLVSWLLKSSTSGTWAPKVNPSVMSFQLELSSTIFCSETLSLKAKNTMKFWPKTELQTSLSTRNVIRKFPLKLLTFSRKCFRDSLNVVLALSQPSNTPFFQPRWMSNFPKKTWNLSYMRLKVHQAEEKRSKLQLPSWAKQTKGQCYSTCQREKFVPTSITDYPNYYYFKHIAIIQEDQLFSSWKHTF